MGLRNRKGKLKTEKLTIDNEDYFIRVMSGDERHALETKCFGKDIQGKDKPNFAGELLTRTLCDEQGKREFSDEETALVMKEDSTLLDDLYTASFKLNKLGPKGVDEAKND